MLFFWIVNVYYHQSCRIQRDSQIYFICCYFIYCLTCFIFFYCLFYSISVHTVVYCLFLLLLVFLKLYDATSIKATVYAVLRVPLVCLYLLQVNVQSITTQNSTCRTTSRSHNIDKSFNRERRGRTKREKRRYGCMKAFTTTLFSQQGEEWMFMCGGKVAMCFKSVLHVCDKACLHQHSLPTLVWPTARTFHPSHVSGLTLDPNWHYCGEGVWSPRQKCLNSHCETWAHQRGHFSLGGGNQKLTNTNKSSSFWLSGITPPTVGNIKWDLSVLLGSDRTQFLTGHGWSWLHQMQRLFYSLSTNLVNTNPLVFPHKCSHSWDEALWESIGLHCSWESSNSDVDWLSLSSITG